MSRGVALTAGGVAGGAAAALLLTRLLGYLLYKVSPRDPALFRAGIRGDDRRRAGSQPGPGVARDADRPGPSAAIGVILVPLRFDFRNSTLRKVPRDWAPGSLPGVGQSTIRTVRKSPREQYLREPAAVSMVMFVARVAAKMAAPARVPTAKILPAAEALRRMPAAKRTEASRAGWLAGRSRKAFAHKGLVRPCPDIAPLRACFGRAVGGLPRVTCRWLDAVMGLQGRSGVAAARRLVTPAGADSKPVARIAVRRLRDQSLFRCAPCIRCLADRRSRAADARMSASLARCIRRLGGRRCRAADARMFASLSRCIRCLVDRSCRARMSSVNVARCIHCLVGHSCWLTG